MSDPTTSPAPEHSTETRHDFAQQALQDFGFDFWEVEDILKKFSAEHVLATESRYRDRQNEADADEIRKPKAYFRWLLDEKKAPKGKTTTGIGGPENVTKVGDERWELIKEAHTNVETGVCNVEAAARDWLYLQLSGLDQQGKLPADYRVWASLVAWAPNNDRTIELDWHGKPAQRRIKKGEYMIPLPKLVETLREIGKAAWAAAFERLVPTPGE